MTDKPNKIFLGQLYEHDGKYGMYMTGPCGKVRYWVERSKEAGRWNMYLTQNEPREQSDAKQQPKQDAFPHDEESPF